MDESILESQERGGDDGVYMGKSRPFFIFRIVKYQG